MISKFRTSVANNAVADAEAKKQKETLSRQLQSLTETLNSKIQEKNSLLTKRKSLNVDLEDTKIQGGQKVARKKTIEEMESNYEGYNYAVKYIMRSNTAGIDGVVSDCMSVPKGYETAIETAIECDAISVSLLQRRLRIGYARAARIVDELDEMGLVGPSEGGGKPRKFLMTKAQFLEMKASKDNASSDTDDYNDEFDILSD